MALIGQVNALARLGLTAHVLKAIDKSKHVTLRFHASDSCTFLKEQTVEVADSQSVETDETESVSASSFFGSSTKSTIKQVIHHVKEYHWNVNVQWAISVYFGTKDEDSLTLNSRSSRTVLITQSHSRAPLPENRECKPLDVSLNWLMKHMDAEGMTANFRVDTQSPSTRTPRRNPQVEDALSFIRDLSQWTRGVRAYFNKCVQQDIVDKHSPACPAPRPNPEGRLTRIDDHDIFVPVQPLFDDSEKETQKVVADSKSILSFQPHDDEEGARASTVLLTAEDMHKFLNEQVRSISARLDSLGKMYPAANQSGNVLTVAEASLVLISWHTERVGMSYTGGVEYVEHMLADQLVAAVGKRIDASDIDQFLRYHNARFLDPPPQPFCHAIRQPGQYPCGILSIEGLQNDGNRVPIETLVREVDSVPSIKVPLNAATCIELTGKTYLHGWIQHRFGPCRNVPELIARARQFSSFLLVVGTMAGPDRLEPKDAIIIQNKDEVIIRLILDEIPTAMEFKDAIRSLSTEQQQFAEAYRKMQLGSSVLGISVIQIKPQLEVLLGLPSGALTKEMKLTQDLMELFVEYQVPSDLLSYDGMDACASPKEKVDNVRAHVEAVSEVISDAKANELKEQAMKAAMAFQRDMFDSPGVIGSTPRSAPSPSMPAEEFIWKGGRPASNDLRLTRMMKTDLPALSESMMKATSHSEPASQATEFSMHRSKDMSPALQIGGNQDSMAPGQPLAVSSAKGIPATDGAIDFTTVPRILDAAIEQHGQGIALRSTTVKLSDSWTRSRQDSLLTEATASELWSADLNVERNKAMDLLDALSRSGSLPIPFSELHVIVSVTHCFEKDVIETIVQDNVNPIEKLEQSTLLVGSAIHGVPAMDLIRHREDLQRLKLSLPVLLGDESNSTT
jgi:hypothetical protein